jgi:hypothetical protein
MPSTVQVARRTAPPAPIPDDWDDDEEDEEEDSQRVWENAYVSPRSPCST